MINPYIFPELLISLIETLLLTYLFFHLFQIRKKYFIFLRNCSEPPYSKMKSE